ncbi:MAG TPA: hypothetical protein VM347_37940, partial [Nonomuraea sp.]|nr:hypothetical protein [Nonomuraea sp.]
PRRRVRQRTRMHPRWPGRSLLSHGWFVIIKNLVRKQAGIAFPGISDDNVVDRTALIGPSDRFRFAPRGRVVIDGLGEIPAHFHRTERGVFTILGHDPERPLVNTAEWEDHPAGDW